MSRSIYKEDSFFIALSMMSWASTLPMVVAGVWADPRWFAMACLAFLMGFIFGVISVSLDKEYAKRRVLK